MSLKIFYNAKPAKFMYFLLLGLAIFGLLTTTNVVLRSGFGAFVLLSVIWSQRTLIILTAIMIRAITRNDLERYYLAMMMYHLRRRMVLILIDSKKFNCDDEIAVHTKAAQFYYKKLRAVKFRHRPGQNVRYVRY